MIRRDIPILRAIRDALHCECGKEQHHAEAVAALEALETALVEISERRGKAAHNPGEAARDILEGRA